jgi:hypothetical protein
VSGRVSEDEGRELRGAYQAALEGAAAAGPDVDEDRVWRAVTGDLPAAERRQVVELVARHPSWALAWSLARELAAASPETREAPPAARRRGGGAPPILALAAGLVLALGAAVTLLWPPAAPRYRDPAAAAIDSLTPGAAVTAANGCRLRWSGPPGATFELRLTSEDLDHVHVAPGLARAEYRVPREFLSRLAPGSRLLWQVEAHLAGGGRLSSATFVALHDEECRS